MSGIFGSSREDMAREWELDKYLETLESMKCGCIVTPAKGFDHNFVAIHGEICSVETIEGNDDCCPECGGEFDMKWFEE